MTTLTFVGDTFISSPLQRTKELDAVVTALQEGNLVFANLEQVLTKKEPPAYPTEKTFGVYSAHSCLLYTSQSPRDVEASRMPGSAWKK